MHALAISDSKSDSLLYHDFSSCMIYSKSYSASIAHTRGCTHEFQRSLSERNHMPAGSTDLSVNFEVALGLSSAEYKAVHLLFTANHPPGRRACWARITRDPGKKMLSCGMHVLPYFDLH